MPRTFYRLLTNKIGFFPSLLCFCSPKSVSRTISPLEDLDKCFESSNTVLKSDLAFEYFLYYVHLMGPRIFETSLLEHIQRISPDYLLLWLNGLTNVFSNTQDLQIIGLYIVKM